MDRAVVKSLIPVIRRERAGSLRLGWHSQALAAGERMDGSGECALSGEARHDPTRPLHQRECYHCHGLYVRLLLGACLRKLSDVEVEAWRRSIQTPGIARMTTTRVGCM